MYMTLFHQYFLSIASIMDVIVNIHTYCMYGVGYNMSPCIRRYSKYLNAKAVSYRQMAYDFCKIKKG